MYEPAPPTSSWGASAGPQTASYGSGYSPGPNPFATIAPSGPPGYQYGGAMPQQRAPPTVPGLTASMQPMPPMAASFSQAPEVPGGPPPEVHYSRVHIKLPVPRCPGATEFYGNVPKRAATFAWTELCATPAPDSSLAPSPNVPGKQWFNSYIYIPEQRSHVERQFLDRFVPGPNGEWLDATKAQRMTTFLDEKRAAAIRAAEAQAMMMSGSAVQPTRFVNSYTGQHLYSCRGELRTKEDLLEEYDLHPSAAQLREMTHESAPPFFDFDNLRLSWPFDAPDRNKVVTQETYNRIDRRSAYMPHDRSLELLELPSMYVESGEYDRS